MADDIRLLHVDDDADFADMAALSLEAEDDRFSVDTATSAAEGLDRLTPAIDCVISDYEMPGTNGIELIATVRETYPDLPIILFTGKGSEAVASDAISAGVTDYLRKRPGQEQYELLATRIRTAVGQYRAEQELDRQNDLFVKTQELADVGAWEYVPGDDEVYFTEQVYDIYGVTPDYEPGPEKDLRQFYHPADRDAVRAAMDAAWNDGEPYDIEARITAADGTEKWIRTLGDPQFVDGTCERVRGTIRDVTVRKEREQDLEQTKEWYRALLDGAPDAVFVADAESGEIRETNRAATRLLDQPREEIVGRHQTDLHPPDRVDDYAALFEEHVTSGAGRDETIGNQVDIYVADASGAEIPVEINARTVEVDGEQYIQGYFRDITDRKERERELKRRNDRLDEFATVASHDLRNPLHTLSTSLELLETDDDELLDRCRRSVDRMEHLLDDLSTLARHGETATDPGPIAVEEIARACATTTLPSDVTVSIETDATVIAEAGRLKQLFENLFANAVTHGQADVSITVGDTDDGFYVEDDGRGVPQAERENIFDIGYSTRTDGTGFGLSIVKQVVETNDWEIRVTDSDAGGARFEITAVDFADG